MSKKKRKLRIDRVILVAVIGIALLFGVYKGVSFAAMQVRAFFSPKESVENVVDKEEEETFVATVIIDPGHGGKDAGSNTKKLYEKNISLTTSKYVGEALAKENIKVVYTRIDDNHLDDDKDTDLKLRAAFSQKYNADFFVSIHVNDFEDSTTVSGFEIYKKDDTSDALANSIGTSMEKLNYSKNRGVLDGGILLVLKENTVPSVLVELGYIKGPDYSYLSDNEKLEKIGQAIADGIIEQVNKKK